ncbi:hypothetical protein [Streptomyces sp. NPDC005859]|uniref:hypothetical protein n=1 Tax=Streptomyces sp. NPDC005859 TaxID=3157170 RepID=UPI00340BCE36
MSASEIGYRVVRHGDKAPKDGTLWRTEAESRSRVAAGDRPALQEVLFCLRADLVDGIRVSRWDDLGDPITREMVRDEIRDHRATLTVAGDVIEPDHPLRNPERGVRNQVQATCAALRALLPRQRGTQGQLDIGRGLGKNEVVRLAHKLHFGFQLTLAQTADLLNQAGYMWDGVQGEQDFNKQIVHRLLQDACWDDDAPRTVDGERIRTSGRSHQVLQEIEVMAVYGPDDERDHLTRSRDVQNIAKAHDHLFAFSFTPSTPDFGLTDLLHFVTTPAPVRTLYVADSSLFPSELDRLVAYRWVEHFGVQVLEAGKSVKSTVEGSRQERVLREVIKTFAALRMHDSHTVIETTRSIDHARAVAKRLRSQAGYSYEEIARHLRLEAIPTRKRSGDWGRSAVMDLVSGDAAS